MLARAHHFGGALFYLCETTLTDMVHLDPSQFASIAAGGAPAAFLDALRYGVPAYVDAVTSLPATIEALCLTERGREMVAARAPMRALVGVLTHKAYAACVVPAEFGPRLEELLRHLHADMRAACVDALLAMLRVLCAVGGDAAALAWAPDAAAAAAPPCLLYTSPSPRDS